MGDDTEPVDVSVRVLEADGVHEVRVPGVHTLRASTPTRVKAAKAAEMIFTDTISTLKRSPRGRDQKSVLRRGAGNNERDPPLATIVGL